MLFFMPISSPESCILIRYLPRLADSRLAALLVVVLRGYGMTSVRGSLRGIVLHTGPRPFELGDRLWALLTCALWSPMW